MKIIKIDMAQIDGEINAIENSGYKECKRTDKKSCLSICFKEKGYNKRQKTVYFKIA